jgi:hypothetical protein
MHLLFFYKDITLEVWFESKLGNLSNKGQFKPTRGTRTLN